MRADPPPEKWAPQIERDARAPEQKADAVRLVRQVGSVPRVARDLDLTETALRHWVKQADIDEGKGPEGSLTTEGLEELRQLRREVRTLEMERDFQQRPSTRATRTESAWPSTASRSA